MLSPAKQVRALYPKPVNSYLCTSSPCRVGGMPSYNLIIPDHEVVISSLSTFRSLTHAPCVNSVCHTQNVTKTQSEFDMIVALPKLFVQSIIINHESVHSIQAALPTIFISCETESSGQPRHYKKWSVRKYEIGFEGEPGKSSPCQYCRCG